MPTRCRVLLAAVGTDRVIGRQVVDTIRACDMDGHAVVVLIESRHSVTPTNIRTVFARPLGEHSTNPRC